MKYETDYHAWAFEQAGRLRAGGAIDRENIAEELEDLGKRQQQQLVNRLAILLAHLLKWEFQPQRRSPSWTGTINEQRKRIARLLIQMPSLQSRVNESIEEAYEIAVTLASTETGKPEEDFPDRCPYAFAGIMDARRAAFAATHIVRFDCGEVYEVMLDGEGRAYTQQEWEGYLEADFTVAGGKWLFLGHPIAGTVEEA